MIGYLVAPRGGNFLRPGGKWQGAAIGSSFFDAGLTIV